MTGPGLGERVLERVIMPRGGGMASEGWVGGSGGGNVDGAGGCSVSPASTERDEMISGPVSVTAAAG